MSTLRDMLAAEFGSIVADDAGLGESCWIDDVEIPVVANEQEAFAPSTDTLGRKAEQTVRLLAAAEAVGSTEIVEGTAVEFRNLDWVVSRVDQHDEIMVGFTIQRVQARKHGGSKAFR